MKKQLKKSILTCICLSALCFTIASCSSNNQDPKEIAEDHNDAKFDEAKEKDAKFLVDAATINLEEIQLSELATTKAVASDIKQLAAMMLDDHSKSLAELKTLSEKKMITLPTSLSANAQEAYDRLNEMSGTDFDKKYSEMMVNGHKAAVKEFETASNEAMDMEIRDWASKTLPDLRTHLDHAMTCSEKYK